LAVITGWQGGKVLPEELLDELELDEELLLELELPGSGAVGQPPVTTVPPQVALPVLQSITHSWVRLSANTPVPPVTGLTRLIWLPDPADGFKTVC
jgi:hypothetical protein